MTDSPGSRPPVSHGDGDRTGRLARLHVDRHLDAPRSIVERDDIAAVDPEAGGDGRRNRRVIAPRHLGYRIRQFLQPGVVGLGSVAPRAGFIEMQFIAIRVSPPRRLAAIADDARGPRY